MTNTKTRHGELPVPAAAASVIAPAGIAPPAHTGADEPLAERARAPLDLARALARARETERPADTGLRRGATDGTGHASEASGAAPGAPPAPRPTAGRLTPMRGSVAIARTTPARGGMAVAGSGGTPGGWAPSPSSLRERARGRIGTVDLLVFRIAREWFGVELGAVEEAIDLPTVRHVAEMPDAMLGVVTVRGALTSVYSPAAALGVVLDAGTSALVFRRERGRLGLVVDDVDDVHTLDLAQLRDPPSQEAIDGLVLGVLRHGEGLLALVDAETLIAACQSVFRREIA